MWEKTIAIGTVVITLQGCVLIWLAFNRPTIHWLAVAVYASVVAALCVTTIYSFKILRLRRNFTPDTPLQEPKPETHKLELELPTLADRIFALCKEMRLYLRTVEPLPDYGPYSPGSEPGPKWLSEVVIPWQKKFDAGYMRRFNDRVVTIRHELAERGLSDGEIDSFIAGDVHDDRMLRTTIKALITLGAELDD
jgi:hypothetical protein